MKSIHELKAEYQNNRLPSFIELVDIIKYEKDGLLHNPLIKRDAALKIQAVLKKMTDSITSDEDDQIKLAASLLILRDFFQSLSILQAVEYNDYQYDNLITNIFIDRVVISSKIEIAELDKDITKYQDLLPVLSSLQKHITVINSLEDVASHSELSAFKQCYKNEFYGLGIKSTDELKNYIKELITNLQTNLDEVDGEKDIIVEKTREIILLSTTFVPLATGLPIATTDPTESSGPIPTTPRRGTLPLYTAGQHDTQQPSQELAASTAPSSPPSIRAERKKARRIEAESRKEVSRHNREARRSLDQELGASTIKPKPE